MLAKTWCALARSLRRLNLRVGRSSGTAIFRTVYEFFSVDVETGKIHEFDQIFGLEAQQQFWMKLDDLVADLALLLERSRLDSTSDAGVSP